MCMYIPRTEAGTYKHCFLGVGEVTQETPYKQSKLEVLLIGVGMMCLQPICFCFKAFHITGEINP